MWYVVFTGDIVDSTALDAGALDSVVTGVQRAITEVFDWDNTARHGFRRRSGDGWQAAIAAPHLALRAALYLRASMAELAAPSRFAVALGEGTLPDDGDTNRGHGPVFTASGRLLDQLPRHSRMAFAGGGAEAACFALADAIAGDWTQAQARALTLMLPPGAGTRAEAAEALGISRQAVDQSLNGAGFRALKAALAAWEAPR